MLPDISDTFRLLIESMDFIEQDGNGWSVLLDLCDASCSADGEPRARMALLVWILRLVSSEIKMCGLQRHYARLWSWTLNSGAELGEASRLILCLGGPEFIDEPIYDDGGYTTLHSHAAYAESQEALSVVLAQRPDVHRLGRDCDDSPEEESPFSLVLYSSWAFRSFLDALVIAGKDFEEFVTQEIQRNHNIHPGWEKETLLNLSTYNYVNDYVPRSFWECNDCTQDQCFIKVQPHWRHFLERIKHGIDPYYSPVEARSEVDKEESTGGDSVAEGVDNPDDPTGLEDASSELDAESESGSELEIESKSESKGRWEPEWEPGHPDPHDYPTTVSLLSDCIYCPHEVVCMNCWLYYIKTGTRRYADKRLIPC